MNQSKFWTAVMTLAFACAAPVWAGDHPAAEPALPSQATVQKAADPDKRMDHIIDQAEKGFPKKFTEAEVMDVMKASQLLKKEHRPLAIRLERIGSKMSHTEQ